MKCATRWQDYRPDIVIVCCRTTEPSWDNSAKDTSTDTLRTLYVKAREGESEAEEALFSALRVRFFVLAKRRVQNRHAEDVVHDACTIILGKFGSLSPDIEFDAWSYKVLRNVIANHLRTQTVRRITVTDTEIVERLPEDSYDADELRLRRNLEHCLVKLAEARPEYARALRLSLEGYSTKQICDRFGLNRNNLYVMLHRSREWLRSCLARRTDHDR